jgi:hypothetical protein
MVRSAWWRVSKNESADGKESNYLRKSRGKTWSCRVEKTLQTTMRCSDCHDSPSQTTIRIFRSKVRPRRKQALESSHHFSRNVHSCKRLSRRNQQFSVTDFITLGKLHLDGKQDEGQNHPRQAGAANSSPSQRRSTRTSCPPMAINHDHTES